MLTKATGVVMEKKNDITRLISKYLSNLSIGRDDRQALVSARTQIRTCLRQGFQGAKFLTQGSFRYRTINRPCWPPKQQMDMDDGMYLSYTTVEGVSPGRLLDRVEDALSSEGWKLQKKNSCVRVVLGEDKHIDIPVYRAPASEMPDVVDHQNSARAKIFEDWGLTGPALQSVRGVELAHRTDGWKKSDPRNIIDWVATCLERHGQLFIRLCRVLKGWRDHQWPEQSPLSSILIMALVDEAMQEGCIAGDMPDGGALFEVSRLLEDVFDKGVSDPDKEVNKLLTDDLSPDEKEECKNKFRVLHKTLSDVMYEEKGGCIRELKEVFGKFFPGDPALIGKLKTTQAAATVVAPITPKAQPYADTEQVPRDLHLGHGFNLGLWAQHWHTGPQGVHESGWGLCIKYFRRQRKRC